MSRWKFTRYSVTEPRWTAGVNRIMGYRIGWYVVLGRWFYGVHKRESLETQRERASRRLQ